MVVCGTQHFKTNLQVNGDQWDEETIYPALRDYNSGHHIDTNLSEKADGKSGNYFYVSEIAQRLQGWTG